MRSSGNVLSYKPTDCDWDFFDGKDGDDEDENARFLRAVFIGSAISCDSQSTFMTDIFDFDNFNLKFNVQRRFTMVTVVAVLH